MKTIYKVAGVTIVIVAALIIIVNAIEKNRGPKPEDLIYEQRTYEQKVMTVAEVEKSQPTAFLSANGTFNQNFWGTKIKVHGVITNKATVASYKDAVIRVSYLSKTETVLGSKDYTIYEVFYPTSTTKFELKVDNYKDVAKIACDVVSAVAN